MDINFFQFINHCYRNTDSKRQGNHVGSYRKYQTDESSFQTGHKLLSQWIMAVYRSAVSFIQNVIYLDIVSSLISNYTTVICTPSIIIIHENKCIGRTLNIARQINIKLCTIKKGYVFLSLIKFIRRCFFVQKSCSWNMTALLKNVFPQTKGWT